MMTLASQLDLKAYSVKAREWSGNFVTVLLCSVILCFQIDDSDHELFC